MCGRYTLSTPGDLVAEHFDLETTTELAPRYNIAPTQDAPVVRAAEGGRRLDLLRWGLVPFWAEDPSAGSRMINARVESAATKPAFRDAFRERRCLVPADGFYEWKKAGRSKHPFHVRRTDGGLLAFAGLWARWRRGDDRLESFTILTTAPDEVVAELHDRMPLILPREVWQAWLGTPPEEAESLEELLVSLPRTPLELVAVDPAVGDPRNEGPELLRRVAPRQESLF